MFPVLMQAAMACGITVTSNPDPARLESLAVNTWPIWSCEVSSFPWSYHEQGSSLSSSAGDRFVYVVPVNPLSQIEPLAVHRTGFVHSTFLMVLSAIAQLLLLLLQPLPALAVDLCPSGMALIPGGSYRIGVGAQLPEEQAGRSLRISPFCLDRSEVTNDRFADNRQHRRQGFLSVAPGPASCRRPIVQSLQDTVSTCNDPRQRGKGLRAGLTRLWRYRVGDYRVICQIGVSRPYRQRPANRSTAEAAIAGLAAL
jgi:hypothetical protein